jgi:hypothetical protein
MKTGIGSVVEETHRHAALKSISEIGLKNKTHNRKMRRNVELVERKRNLRTKCSRNWPPEQLQVHQSIVDSVCILFTDAFLCLPFFI